MCVLSFIGDFFRLGSYYWIPKFCIILSLVILIWQWRCRWRYCYAENRRIKNLKLLGSLMAFVWAMGFGLYMYAIDHANLGTEQTKQLATHLSRLELCFRSAIASLDMFMFNIDSNILDKITDYPVVKGMISLFSFIAGILTIWLIISMFGARIWSSVKSLWSSLFKSDDELCIFFGINRPSKILAQSIWQEAENGNQKYGNRKFRLVFV